MRAHARGLALLLGVSLSAGWLHADTLAIAGLLTGTHGTFTMSVPEGNAFWELLIGLAALVVVDVIRRRSIASKAKLTQQPRKTDQRSESSQGTGLSKSN